MASFTSEESSDSFTSSNTVIAITRDKNSQFAVKWAVENLFGRKRSGECVLIHVQNQNLHSHDDNTDSFHKEDHSQAEEELRQFFLPYRGFCARKGILAKELILHDIDVPNALIDYISNHSVNNIVVGASSRNAIIKKFKHPDVPTSLLRSAPESCSVYVIARGKVQSKRLSKRRSIDGILTPSGTSIERSTSILRQHVDSDASLSKDNIRKLHVDVMDRRGSGINQDSPSTIGGILGKSNYQSSPGTSTSDFSGPLSFKSMETSSENLDLSYASESRSRNSISSHTLSALDAEMRKLRSELKLTVDMYDSACKDASVAKQKARELQQLKTEKERMLEHVESADEALQVLAEFERQKSKAAKEAALMAQKLAELEMQKKQNAEVKAMNEAEEKKKAVELFENKNVYYRRYSIEEIEVGTDHFNESNKIGEGGYGPVYKATLEFTEVAVKILRPDRSHGQRQFQQEIEVLSCMRHPHMVLLLGACPEYGCLVYEYMENGSLEDRLFQKHNTPPIPWNTRFKIASDIATALLFLHQMKPEPLVHRDLKPANILLDQNYVSKIGDVGLARLVPPSIADDVTQYHMTAAAGTFCYIDPEYQQTGMLGVKSDIYSFGVLLLQLITAKSPMGLSYQIEESIKNDSFSDLLDPAVPDWPVEEALSLAKLALGCCELRKRDRPDLRREILPELIRLRDFGLCKPSKGANNISLKLHSPDRPMHNYVRPCQRLPEDEEMNVRKRWHRVKNKAKSWTHKHVATNSNFQQVKKLWSSKYSFARPSGREQQQEEDGDDGDGEVYMRQPRPHPHHPSEGCWPLVSCASSAHVRGNKLKSFS